MTSWVVYCVTEADFFVTTSVSAPTTCPNNVAHTIDSTFTAPWSDPAYRRILHPSDKFTVCNPRDTSIGFRVSLPATSGMMVLRCQHTANRTIDLPDASDVLAGLSTADTFTNKTMTSSTNNVVSRGLFTNSGSNIVSTYAAVAPSTGQVLTATSSTTATWQTPAGAENSFDDDEYKFRNAADGSKRAFFDCSQITTGTNRTYTFPDTSDTFIVEDFAQTMTNKTMTSNTNNITARGLLCASGATTVSVYAAAAPTSGKVLTATSATTATWQTPSSTTQFDDDQFQLRDNVDGGKRVEFQCSAISTSTTRTFTFPNANDTFAVLALAQTFTNKTMTSNTNNLIARELWVGSGAASVSTYAATAPVADQVLTATAGTTATWQYPPVKYASAEASSTISTSSTSYIAMSSMSITPPVAGTYLVQFEGVVVISGGMTGSCAIYNNGVQHAASVRSIQHDGPDHHWGTSAVVTYTTGTIDIYWKTSSSTISHRNRSLTAIRVAA